MIHQFAELGQFYLECEGVKDRLLQYAADPSAKFRTKEILLLVFSLGGFERVQVTEYDQDRRLRCLYRQGPSNGWDATPTTGMATVSKKGQEHTIDLEIGKKLSRLARSINEGLQLGEDLDAWEREALAAMRDHLQSPKDRKASANDDPRSTIFTRLREAHPDLKQPAILSVAWQSSEGGLRWVGEFKAFQQALIRKGSESGSKKKTIKGEVKGVGQCCICGKRNTEVSGLLKVWHPPLYTTDKLGSISGGFSQLEAWRNFPACRECCDKVDFSVERIKKDLSFSYYGFKYLLLPSPVLLAPTDAYQCLGRLVSARVDRKASKRLTEAEDELLEIVAEENNRLQIDLLFYQPDQQSFRPALYISGLLPFRFRQLFQAQARVDQHPWLQLPSPKSFTERKFTFGCFRNIFPSARGGSTFDDDFLAATRAALEIRLHRADRMLEIGMRWVQEDYLEGKAWPFRLADLFRSLLFFEELTRRYNERNQPMTTVDYGDSEQADRVRLLFQQAPETSRLRTDPATQAAFLVGSCCSRIEGIQWAQRRSTPFEGKYKGFRLNQADIQRLFLAAKDKAKAYGKENVLRHLLECAASALTAAPDAWSLGPEEVSYYFALGHALRPRLAKEQEDEEPSPATTEETNP